VSWIEVARVIAFALVALSAFAFCLSYNKWTGGRWRATPYGVHMMVFSGAFVVYFVYAILSLLVLPAEWRPYSGTVLALSLAGLFWWRTSLLRTAQRERVTAEAEDAADYRGDHPPKA
jgi:hypothetical protein